MKLMQPITTRSHHLTRKNAFVLVSVPVILCLAAVLPARAAAPLSQLVDEKVGLYLEATELNSHIRQFLVSPLVNRFRQTQVFQNWLQSQDVINLKQAVRDIESVTGQPLLPLLNQFFGKSAGLAVFNHGPKQNPSLLLLTTVHDREAMQKLLEAWFAKTGIKVTPSTFQGITCYEVRQQSDPAAPAITYAFLDQTLVPISNRPFASTMLSDSKSSLRKISRVCSIWKCTVAPGESWHRMSPVRSF